MKIGAVILAGGKSSRMGRDKASLTIGGQTFLEKIAAELSDFEELLISVDNAEQYPSLSYPKVCDKRKDCGPMGGLSSALWACRSEALLAVACDTPMFTKKLADYLVSQMDENTDAVISMSEGRVHPLCGIYAKDCAAVFESRLQQDDFKIRSALKELRVKYIDLSGGEFSEILNANINTPEEYKAVCLKEADHA